MGSGPSAATSVTTPAEDAGMIVACTWLVGGLFIDGWAHNTRPSLETFFTPWHAVFYSGFVVTVAWLGVIIRRRLPVTSLQRAVPSGYGWSVVGVALFAVSGVADLVWHQVFGIERNVAALLSPSHLGLFLGALLVVTGPWRAAVARYDRDAARLVPWHPAIWSLTLAGSLGAFILQNWHPLKTNPIATQYGQAVLVSGRPAYFANDYQVEAGVASFLIATVFLFGPLLLLVRRHGWVAGAPTLLITVQCFLLQAMVELRAGHLVWFAAVGAVAVELIGIACRPDRSRSRLLAFATVAPVIFWALFVAGVALTDGVRWKAELWTGSVVWSGLTGLAVATLLVQQEALRSVDAHAQTIA